MGLLRQNAIPFAENTSIIKFLFRKEPLFLATLIEKGEVILESEPEATTAKLAAELAAEKLRSIQLEHKLKRLKRS